MRFTGFLMGVLVLVLSCLPCADAAEKYCESAKAGQELKQLPAEEHDHTDHCSPFCHCTCCTCFNVSHNKVGIACIIPKRNPQYTSRYLSALNGVSVPVFQPPRLLII